MLRYSFLPAPMFCEGCLAVMWLQNRSKLPNRKILADQSDGEDTEFVLCCLSPDFRTENVFSEWLSAAVSWASENSLKTSGDKRSLTAKACTLDNMFTGRKFS